MTIAVVDVETRPTPSMGLELTGDQQFALFARILDRQGFSGDLVDTLSGHITYRQPDGLILINPFGLPWSD